MKDFIKKRLPGALWKQLRFLKHRAIVAFRGMVERSGFVIARKSDFYSPLPSEAALRKTRSRWAKPSALLGVSCDLGEMKNRLLELKNTSYDEFARLPSYQELCTIGYGPGFPQVDAIYLVRDDPEITTGPLF